MTSPALKGVLVWKDGRREAMKAEHVGGDAFHFIRRDDDGHAIETVFHADEVEDGHVIVYREGETRNIDREMAEARKCNEENTMRVIRRGLGLKPQPKARA